MRSATLVGGQASIVLLAGLGALCAGCPKQSTAATCSSSNAPCPTGEVCIGGACQALSPLSRSFAAVVVPSDPDLAPQEYLGIDPGAGPNDLTLTLPATFDATIPIPAICSADEALPFALGFAGHPLLPIVDWTFGFRSNLLGTLSGAVPAGQPLDVVLSTALPCAAPGVQLDQVWLGGPIDPSSLNAFLPPAQTLTVVGTFSNLGGTAPVAGASVTILAASGPRAGQPISATVITQPNAASCDAGYGYCSPVGFILPVPLDQVILDGGGCVPSTQPAPCNLDGGCPFTPCATLMLEVGPSAADDGGTLPTVDFLVQRQITPIDPSANHGLEAGPTLSLMGDDQLGIRLPIGPGNAFVAGTVYQGPSRQPVFGALVELRSIGPDGGTMLSSCIGKPLVATDPSGATLCSYRTRAVTDFMSGGFAMQAPPGTYSLTVVPAATQPTLAPSLPLTVVVPADGGPAAQQLLKIPPATRVQGQVIDPRNSRPLAGGLVSVFPVNSEQFLGATTIDDHGDFSMQLAPSSSASPYLLTFHPPDGLGLTDSSQIVSVHATTLDLGAQPVAVAVPLSGAVFAQTIDGSRRPVGGASVRFYLFLATSLQGVVTVPVASTVTDPLGHYAVVVPNVPLQ